MIRIYVKLVSVLSRIHQLVLRFPTLIILFGGSLISGLVMFLIRYVFRALFYPTAVAGVIGFFILLLTMEKARFTKQSARFFAVLFIILIHAILALGTKHYASYLHFQYVYTNAVQLNSKLDPATYNTDSFLISKTGSSGIVGFVKYEIDAGAEITDAYHNPKHISHQEYLNYQILDLFALLITPFNLVIFRERRIRMRRIRMQTN